MPEREGKCSGAHWEVIEHVSVLGDGSEATKPRRQSRVPEEEDEAEDGSTGRPGLCSSVKRKKTSTRASGMSRGGTPLEVSARTASGSCGCARVGARERNRGGDEHGGRSERARGCA